MGKEKPLVSGEQLQVKSIDKTTKIDVTVNKDELMTIFICYKYIEVF